MGRRGGLSETAETLASGLHGFAAERSGDGRVHHHLSEWAGELVEGFDGFADDLVVVALHEAAEFGGGQLDGGVDIGRELWPSGGLLAFVQGVKDDLRFITGFDELAGADVFLGVVEGVQDHGFDLFVGEAIGGFDFNLSLFAAALFEGADVQDPIGVDEEFDLNAGQAGDHGRDAFEVKAGERAAVFGHLAFTLQDVDGDVGLAIDAGGEVFRG